MGKDGETGNLTAKREPEGGSRWIEESLVRIKQMPEGGSLEITLPQGVDHIVFIGEVGREPQQPTEFGGLFNTITRSMLVKRGYSRGGFNNPRVEFTSPRRNKDNTTDDVFFHTHPWGPNEVIGDMRDPRQSCLPSGQDGNNTLAIRMIEDEAGFGGVTVSIIAAGGWVSITEARGIAWDEAGLRMAGLNDGDIARLRTELSLGPQPYCANLAKDEESRVELMRLVGEFYQQKLVANGVPFGERLTRLRQQLLPLTEQNLMFSGIRTTGADKLVEWIERHLPVVPVKSNYPKGAREEIEKVVGLSVRVVNIDAQ